MITSFDGASVSSHYCGRRRHLAVHSLHCNSKSGSVVWDKLNPTLELLEKYQLADWCRVHRDVILPEEKSSCFLWPCCFSCLLLSSRHSQSMFTPLSFPFGLLNRIFLLDSACLLSCEASGKNTAVTFCSSGQVALAFFQASKQTNKQQVQHTWAGNESTSTEVASHHRLNPKCNSHSLTNWLTI